MQLSERILETLSSFPQHTILGIGDLILDQYRRGKAVGLSPEAPAIDLLNPGLVEMPGGAANVAWNIGYLGGNVIMIGVVGRDAEADALRALLNRTPGVKLLPTVDPTRPTTLKLRFYHEQFQVLRVNQESREPLGAEVVRACGRQILQAATVCQAVFIEDYGKGLISSGLVDTLMDLRHAHPTLPVILDPKVGNHGVYRPGMCTLIKPNWAEACALVGEDPERARHGAIGRALAEQYQCAVLITLGPKGVYLYEERENREVILPTRERAAFDVAGAGDTTLAVLSLSLASGAALVEAAILANLAGGIVIEKSGTAYATPEGIIAELRHPKTQEIMTRLSKEVPTLGVRERVRSTP